MVATPHGTYGPCPACKGTRIAYKFPMPFKPVDCTLCENGWIPRLEDRPEALREACSALETRPCPSCGDPLVEGSYIQKDGSSNTAWACIECNLLFDDKETVDG